METAIINQGCLEALTEGVGIKGVARQLHEGKGLQGICPKPEACNPEP